MITQDYVLEQGIYFSIIALLSILSKNYISICVYSITYFLIRHSTELSRQHISGSSPKALNYTVCMSKDIKTAHDFLLPQSFWDGHSEKDLKTMQHLLKNPIWQVKTNIFCKILTIIRKNVLDSLALQQYLKICFSIRGI